MLSVRTSEDSYTASQHTITQHSTSVATFPRLAMVVQAVCLDKTALTTVDGTPTGMENTVKDVQSGAKMVASAEDCAKANYYFL